MRYELSCEIVRDLLPSYIDQLTSEDTNESVAAHLDKCTDCKRMYMDMAGEDYSGTYDEISEQADAKAVDFLKKTRNRGRKMVLGAALLTMAAVLVVVFIRTYVFGEKTSPVLIHYQIQRLGEGFDFSGYLMDENRGVSDVKWEEKDGILNVTVENTEVSFFHKNYFDYYYQPESTIREIRLNEKVVIWCDGTAIAPQVARLYMERTPYIGSMPEVGDVLTATGLNAFLSYNGVEMQTTTEPYGLTLMPGDTITKEAFKEYKSLLPKYGLLVIACVDNMGYINFDMDVEGTVKTIQVTEADGVELLGESPKNYLESAKKLQMLVNKLQLAGESIFLEDAHMIVNDNFAWTIELNIEDEGSVYGIGSALYINGVAKTGGGTSHADGTSWDNWERAAFSMTPEQVGTKLDMDKDSVQIQITLYGEGADMTNTLGEILVDIDPKDEKYYDGATYMRDFRIKGSAETGYYLAEEQGSGGSCPGDGASGPS